MSSDAAGMIASQKDKGRVLVPKRRFPEFRDAGAWTFQPLHSLAKRRTRRNIGEEIARVLTNSAEYGVVDQKDFFEKDIAVQGNLQTYFVVEPGDFVYNPRISTAAPVGPIGKNKVGMGVMSPLYTVFRFNNVEDGFYEHVFRSSLWHGHMRLVSNSGARHDRMAISTDDFMNMPVPAPSPAERRKIADCLFSLDAVIAVERERLTVVRDYKQGLMQALFPTKGQTTPRFRFPEFRGDGEWVERPLGDICDVAQGFGFPERMQGKASGAYPFCKVSDISRAVNQNGGELAIAANYVDEADLTVLGARPVPAGATVFAKIGEALRLNRRAITSVDCLIDNNATALITKDGEAIPYFLFLLSQTIDLNEYCGGAVPSVNKSTLEAIRVRSTSPAEQVKVAACLKFVDALIGAQCKRVEAIISHKAGLIQQLFPTLQEPSA